MKKNCKRNVAAMLVLSNAISSIPAINVIAAESAVKISSETTNVSTEISSPRTKTDLASKKQEDFLNPEYIEYEKKLNELSPEDAKDYALHAPSKYIYNEIYSGTASNGSQIQAYSTSSLPNSYNFVSAGGTGINQKTTEVGWVFAANSLLGTSIRKNFGRSLEFSAQHLRYGTSDNLGNQYQQYRGAKEDGYFNYAAGYWRRDDVSGPVQNYLMPFDDSVNVSINESVLDAYSTENYYVKGTATLSGMGFNPSVLETSNRITSIKSMVYSNGGAFVRFEMDSNGFNTTKTTYNNTSVNNYIPHGVTIVGWNDNYAASNFKNVPSQNGAFVVESSQVPGYTTNRYFYISYDMVKYFYDVSTITDISYKDFYDNLYEYAKVAPEFTDDASSSSDTNIYSMQLQLDSEYNQKITAVSTYNLVPDSNYKVYISTTGNYSDLEECSIKSNANDVTNNGNYKNVENIGYVTFELDNPIYASANSNIIVAFEVQNDIANANTVPKHDSIRTLTEGRNKCAIASSIANMKNGTRTSLGNYSAEIKVYTKNVPDNNDELNDRTWDFGSSYFSEYRPSHLGDGAYYKKNISENGIKIMATDEKPVRIDSCSTKINDIDMNYSGVLVFMGKGDPSERSVVFDVNGPSYIYVTAKAGDSSTTRTVVLQSTTDSSVRQTKTVSDATTLKFHYTGNRDTLSLFSQQDNLHIYSISVIPETENVCTDTKSWDFSELGLTSETTISNDVAVDGLEINATNAKDVKYVNYDNVTDGFKYFRAMDLKGSGDRNYRSISFLAKKNSDIYVTARTSQSQVPHTLSLKVSSESGETSDSGLNVIDGDEFNVFPVTNTLKTFRIRNTGDAQRLLLYSLSDAMRIYKISVVPIDYTYYSINKNWNFSASPFSSLGIISGTYEYTDPYSSGNPSIRFEGSNNRPIRFISASATFENVVYSKAIKMYDCRMANSEKCRISFEVPDSTSTPTNISIVANGGSGQTGNLLIVNEYGYVVGRFNTTETVNKYTATYTGGADRLYVYATNKSSDAVNIFDISISNTNVSSASSNIVSEENILIDSITDTDLEENISLIEDATEISTEETDEINTEEIMSSNEDEISAQDKTDDISYLDNESVDSNINGNAIEDTYEAEISYSEFDIAYNEDAISGENVTKEETTE